MSKNEAILSSKGQLVIPQSIREELGLHEGSKLIIRSTGDSIFIMPKPKDPLQAIFALGKKIKRRDLTEELLRQRKIDREIDAQDDRARLKRNH